MRAILFGKEGVERNSHRVIIDITEDVMFIRFLVTQRLDMRINSIEDPSLYPDIETENYNLTNTINNIAFFKREE